MQLNSLFIVGEKILLLLAFLLTFYRAGSNVALGILTIIALICYLRGYRQAENDFPVNVKSSFKIMLGAMLVAVVFSQNIVISLLWAAWICTRYLPIFIYQPFLKGEFVAQNFLKALAWGSVLCLLFVAGQVFMHKAIIHNGAPRGAGILGIMNVAGMCSIVIPIFVALTMESWQKHQYRLGNIYLVVVLANMATLLLNGTRGAWLATAVAIISYFILFWRPRLRTWLIVLIILAALVLGISQLGIIKNRTANNMENRMSVVTRLQMWELGWKTFLQRPLVGVGYGNVPNYEYKVEQGNYKVVLRDKLNKQDMAHLHNLYMQTLAEAGIVGMTALISFLGSIFYTFWQKRNFLWSKIATVALIGFLGHSMFDYTYGISSEMYLITLVVTLALTQLKKKMY